MTQGGHSQGTPVERARAAAFALQVELSTRIGLRRLGDSDGILREALSSLQLVQETVLRVIDDLRDPDVADSPDARRVQDAARHLADDVLGPFLRHWQPRFAAQEDRRPSGRTLVEHEARWPDAASFRAALRDLSDPLRRINRDLADVTGADLEPPLIRDDERA